VILTVPEELVREALSDSGFRRGLVLIGVACVVLPLLGGAVLVGFFLRAVPRLRAAAHAVAAGDLAHRVSVRSADEMEDLAEDFNYMAERLEEYGQLERTIALEKLKDDLIHMVVHDLRSPLASVLGTLRTLESSDYDPETARALVPGAAQSGEALFGMINDLLDIHKLEDHRLPLETALFDVGRVLAQAASMVQSLASEKGLEVTQTIDEGTPAIKADVGKLRRLIVNLVGNAVKFTRAGGHVELAARRADDGESLHISVSDTGEGIPEEYHDRIFDKFGQVETRQAGRMVSTGLGLTFCKLIAEAHGGRIWVESEMGKGSTFHVMLPPAPLRDAEVEMEEADGL